MPNICKTIPNLLFSGIRNSAGTPVASITLLEKEVIYKIDIEYAPGWDAFPSCFTKTLIVSGPNVGDTYDCGLTVSNLSTQQRAFRLKDIGNKLKTLCGATNLDYYYHIDTSANPTKVDTLYIKYTQTATYTKQATKECFFCKPGGSNALNTDFRIDFVRQVMDNNICTFNNTVQEIASPNDIELWEYAPGQFANCCCPQTSVTVSLQGSPNTAVIHKVNCNNTVSNLTFVAKLKVCTDIFESSPYTIIREIKWSDNNANLYAPQSFVLPNNGEYTYTWSASVNYTTALSHIGGPGFGSYLLQFYYYDVNNVKTLLCETEISVQIEECPTLVPSNNMPNGSFINEWCIREELILLGDNANYKYRLDKFNLFAPLINGNVYSELHVEQEINAVNYVLFDYNPTDNTNYDYQYNFNPIITFNKSRIKFIEGALYDIKYNDLIYHIVGTDVNNSISGPLQLHEIDTILYTGEACSDADFILSPQANTYDYVKNNEHKFFAKRISKTYIPALNGYEYEFDVYSKEMTLQDIIRPVNDGQYQYDVVCNRFWINTPTPKIVYTQYLNFNWIQFGLYGGSTTTLSGAVYTDIIEISSNLALTLDSLYIEPSPFAQYYYSSFVSPMLTEGITLNNFIVKYANVSSIYLNYFKGFKVYEIKVIYDYQNAMINEDIKCPFNYIYKLNSTLNINNECLAYIYTNLNTRDISNALIPSTEHWYSYQNNFCEVLPIDNAKLNDYSSLYLDIIGKWYFNIINAEIIQNTLGQELVNRYKISFDDGVETILVYSCPGSAKGIRLKRKEYNNDFSLILEDTIVVETSLDLNIFQDENKVLYGTIDENSPIPTNTTVPSYIDLTPVSTSVAYQNLLTNPAYDGKGFIGSYFCDVSNESYLALTADNNPDSSFVTYTEAQPVVGSGILKFTADTSYNTLNKHYELSINAFNSYPDITYSGVSLLQSFIGFLPMQNTPNNPEPCRIAPQYTNSYLLADILLQPTVTLYKILTPDYLTTVSYGADIDPEIIVIPHDNPIPFQSEYYVELFLKKELPYLQSELNLHISVSSKSRCPGGYNATGTMYVPNITIGKESKHGFLKGYSDIGLTAPSNNTGNILDINPGETIIVPAVTDCNYGQPIDNDNPGTMEQAVYYRYVFRINLDNNFVDEGVIIVLGRNLGLEIYNLQECDVFARIVPTI